MRVEWGLALVLANWARRESAGLWGRPARCAVPLLLLSRAAVGLWMWRSAAVLVFIVGVVVGDVA